MQNFNRKNSNRKNSKHSRGQLTTQARQPQREQALKSLHAVCSIAHSIARARNQRVKSFRNAPLEKLWRNIRKDIFTALHYFFPSGQYISDPFVFINKNIDTLASKIVEEKMNKHLVNIVSRMRFLEPRIIYYNKAINTICKNACGLYYCEDRNPTSMHDDVTAVIHRFHNTQKRWCYAYEQISTSLTNACSCDDAQIGCFEVYTN